MVVAGGDLSGSENVFVHLLLLGCLAGELVATSLRDTVSLRH